MEHLKAKSRKNHGMLCRFSGKPAAISRLKAHTAARFTKIDYNTITDSEILTAFDLGVKLEHKLLSTHHLRLLIAHIKSKLLQDESNE